MSKLLVPTDFSAGSEAAVRYAFAMARELGCELELLHAYHAPSSTGSLINVEDHMEEGVHQDFEEFHQRMLPLLPKGMVMRKRTEARAPDRAIPRILKAEGDEVVAVIMGTHGQSAVERVFSGSTTQKVIDSIDSPLFAVPKEFVGATIGPRKLLWAVDGERRPDARAAKFAADFASRPDGKLVFLHRGDAAAPDAAMLHALAGHSNYQVVSGSGKGELSAQALEAADAAGADLIVVTHKERGFFAGMFGDSTASATLRRTNIPVLVLPHEQTAS